MSARDTAARHKGHTAGRAGMLASANPYTSPERRALWEAARAFATMPPKPKPTRRHPSPVVAVALAVAAGL